MGLGLTHVLFHLPHAFRHLIVNSLLERQQGKKEGDRITCGLESPSPALLKDDCFISHVHSNQLQSRQATHGKLKKKKKFRQKQTHQTGVMSMAVSLELLTRLLYNQQIICVAWPHLGFIENKYLIYIIKNLLSGWLKNTCLLIDDKNSYLKEK